MQKRLEKEMALRGVLDEKDKLAQREEMLARLDDDD